MIATISPHPAYRCHRRLADPSVGDCERLEVDDAESPEVGDAERLEGPARGAEPELSLKCNKVPPAVRKELALLAEAAGAGAGN